MASSIITLQFFYFLLVDIWFFSSLGLLWGKPLSILVCVFWWMYAPISIVRMLGDGIVGS